MRAAAQFGAHFTFFLLSFSLAENLAFTNRYLDDCQCAAVFSAFSWCDEGKDALVLYGVWFDVGCIVY